MYLPGLEKARFLLGHDLGWETRAATQAAKGLARAGDKIHDPKPAALKALSVKIAIHRAQGLSDNGPICAAGLGQLDVPIKSAVSMSTAGKTTSPSKNGPGLDFGVISGDRGRKRAVGDKITRKKTYGRGVENGEKAHSSPIPGRVTRNSPATGVFPGMLLLGEYEKAGGNGRKTAPRDHRARLREHAAKYNAAIRLGKSRALRGPRYSQGSCVGDFGSRWVLRAGA